MFWNKFDSMLNKESSVQDVLLAPDLDKILLKDLFEKEDCIQETKVRNFQLVKVLSRPDILMELVQLITREPLGDVDAKNRFKDSTIACELLNADVPDIIIKLADVSGEYLDELFGLFASNEVLNPILTSFVTRTLGILICRKPAEVLEYLKRKNNLLDITLKHLNITAVTDLYIRLITAHDKDEFRYEMCEWLNSQRFMQRVAEFLDANKTTDSDYHFNAAQVISDVIRFSREQQLQQLKPTDEIASLAPDTYANELLKTADSDAFILLVVSILLRSASSQSSIVNCLTVLGAPFDFIPVNFDGNEEQKALFSELSYRVVNSRIEKYTRILHPVIPQLHDILKNPPVRNPLIAQLADGDVPLSNRVGQTRLQLVRLFALLVSFGRNQLNQPIYDSGLILTLLDMFFQFYWNSFFHLHVQNCINLIIRNSPVNFTDTPNPMTDHPLLYQLIIVGRLQERIMVAWKANAADEVLNKPRRPYMGHLLAMCMELTPEQAAKNVLLQMLLKDAEISVAQEWNDFMRTTVQPILGIQSRCLAGLHPLQAQSQQLIRPNDVAAFEYSARAPGVGEGNEEKGTEPMTMVKHMDTNPNSQTSTSEKSTDDFRMDNRIIDQTVDEEMRLRSIEDEDDDEDADDEMIGVPEKPQPAVPSDVQPKKETLPWPDIQPLHVAEKDGLKSMEEAENSNSPWDAATKAPEAAIGFSWSDVPVSPEAEWADFSSFASPPSPPENVFFISSVQHSIPNFPNDSDDNPFEFRASCLTPDAVDLGHPENGEDRRPTGDIVMDQPPFGSSHLAHTLSLSPVGSGDVATGIPPQSSLNIPDKTTHNV